jgi:hypothetical protein
LAVTWWRSCYEVDAPSVPWCIITVGLARVSLRSCNPICRISLIFALAISPTLAYLMRDLVVGCDVVSHLAALIGILYLYYAPASYVASNVDGTLKILKAC